MVSEIMESVTLSENAGRIKWWQRRTYTHHMNTILIRTEHAFIGYTLISLLNILYVQHMKYSHIHLMYKTWNILTSPCQQKKNNMKWLNEIKKLTTYESALETVQSPNQCP